MDGIVISQRSCRFWLDSRRVPGGALVLVFVGVVRAFGGGISPRSTGVGARAHTICPHASRVSSRSTHFFHQLRRNLLQESRWNAGLWHISSVSASIHSARQN